MLNSSVGAAGEWLSAGGKMASRKNCADCCWGSLCEETLHISFPQLQTPTEECRNCFYFFLLLIDQTDMHFACFSAWTNWRVAMRTDEPHVPLKPSLLSNILHLGKETCYGGYCNGTKLSRCPHSFSLFSVLWKSHMGYGKSNVVVILSPTNMLLIRPIIALFTRSLSLVQASSGSKDPAGLFEWWKDGWGETWWWRVSHPRFDDWGNRRVKRGPENPDKCGALHAPLFLDTECLS